jgi:flagellar FliL protein
MAKEGPNFVVIGAVIAVVSAASSFAAIRFAMPRQIVVEKVESKAEEPKKEEKKVPTAIKSIGDFVVNLADPSGARYLRTSITVEMEEAEKKGGGEGEGKAAAEPEWLPVYKDVIISLLSRKTASEVTSVAGKERLKDELRELLNQKVPAQVVVGVYFTDFVIQ